MKLACAGAPHLTYCTNIHPGESWPEVKQSLEVHVREIWSRAAGALDRPRCGVGLRLSAIAAAELAAPAELVAFRDYLDRSGLYVFTINGFPYGQFHGARVKERVYLPDWLEDERLEYTNRLAELLAALLPDGEGLTGSVSTVPGAFKPRARTAADADAIGRRLVQHAAFLVQLSRRTGKHIALALEPEPCCFLETTPETISFFKDHVLSRERATELAALTGMGRVAAEDALRAHLGVCFDACHMAVEFEDAALSLRALAAAGIEVHKIQISAGLRAHVKGGDPALVRKLGAYAEGVYLHQVVERRAGTDALTRYLDLPDALAALERAPDGTVRGNESIEWRIHFHVPIYRELAGALTTTQPELSALLDHLRDHATTQHLEVETYTWDVLPEDERRGGVVEAVSRELAWVQERLRRPGAGDAASQGALP